MGQELVARSTREFDRLEVIRRVAERSLTKAAELVGLSERRVRRLGIAYGGARTCRVGVRPSRKISRRFPRLWGPGAESRDCSGLPWDEPNPSHSLASKTTMPSESA